MSRNRNEIKSKLDKERELYAKSQYTLEQDRRELQNIKERLGLSSSGMHSYQQDNRPEHDNLKGRDYSLDYDALASEHLVNTILHQARPITSPSLGNDHVHRSKVDAFEKLVQRDQKARQKYQMSDKDQLQEERSKNAALEESYTQLLKQVQQLQSTHLIDLRNSEQRFHSASASLQKALVSKSEELISLSKKLVAEDARHTRDTQEWQKDRIALLNQIEALSTASAEQISKISDREKRLVEMNNLRKELAERLAVREQDLMKYGKALREREEDYMKERETKHKLEVQYNSLQQAYSQKDALAKDLESQLHRKNNEVEELNAMKVLFNESRRDLEDIQRREKHYMTEIDQLSARERRLFHQVEELSQKERKYQQEIAMALEKDGFQQKEMESLKLKLGDVSRAFQEAQARLSFQDSEIAKIESNTRQYQVEAKKLMSDNAVLQQSVQDFQTQNQALARDLNLVKNSCEMLNTERETMQSKFSYISKQVEAKQREIEELREENSRLLKRLEAEQALAADNRVQNKEKFNLVSAKINDLQDALQETQNQLSVMQANEKSLRSALRQKEDLTIVQMKTIQEAEQKIQNLLQNQNQDVNEMEQFKAKKREEMAKVQEKYAEAKQQMDQEVAQLQLALLQKTAQYNNLYQEYSLVKNDLQDYAVGKQTVESKLSDAVSAENTLNRQLANVKETLSQKTQELQRVSSKNSALQDQVRRLEEEVSMYRDNIAPSKDADISKLQHNMEEMSKRLKTQVDGLIENDPISRSRSSSRNSKYVTAPSAALASFSPRARSPVAELDADFEKLERLLNRPILKNL